MKTASAPIAITSGKGAMLYSEDGKSYIDAISSWWVNLHGHAHPYIADKVHQQLQTLEHVIFAGFTHQPAVDLAERLLAVLPGGQSRVFYSDNGSTAVEVALKMAIQYWHNQGIKKTKIIVLENSYHGDTFGAMSISARSAFTNAFGGLLFDVLTLPFPSNEEKACSELQDIIDKHKEEVTAFIFEPLVLGTAGMKMYAASTLNRLISICRNNAILTIADEVMTGFGRTGKIFAGDHLKDQADIICLSKGLTGGTMALGVTTCSEKIYSAFLSDDPSKTLFHGHSYTANPLACAAANASLDLLLDEKCLQDIKWISAEQAQFADVLKKFENTENVRCLGTILAFEVVTGSGNSYFNSIRDNLYEYFISEGILLRPLGNTLYIMPPYCITSSELQRVYLSIEKKLKRL
jgi:adenosylmethionine-8-amino-7-oxononanoate aminotransferase